MHIAVLTLVGDEALCGRDLVLRYDGSEAVEAGIAFTDWIWFDMAATVDAAHSGHTRREASLKNVLHFWIAGRVII